MTKFSKLAELYDNYINLFKDFEVVIGDGNVEAKVLLVGEAPGRDEVKQKKPFVGMAGKNLTEFIELLQIDRKSLFITNAIKYRLSKVNPKTNSTINRPAKKEEVFRSRFFLINEINIIRPIFIVTLGNIALKSVLNDWNISIGSLHGKATNVLLNDFEYKLFPLYHPASIIYNRALKEVYFKDLGYLRDLIKKLC